MKFDQAFYTWGKNQLSRYREGLGICASSSMDSDFLDSCLAIGSGFSPERSEETSEFVIYDPRLRRYVGVGISPRADGGDGRVNFLCHFFIPRETEENPDPGEYLLKYPFRRDVEDREKIGIWDSEYSEASDFDFKGILETYGLKEKKLAMLLQTAWPCMFGEVSGINIIFDKERRRGDLDLKAAREIAWLLSMMAPGSEHVLAECRKNLSYGVRTKENKNAARILYSEEPAGNGQMFFLDGENDRQEVLPVFMYMAELAEQSVEDYRAFTEELLNIRKSGKFRCVQLSVVFLRWKLLHGQYVSKEDVAHEINDILSAALSSPWESAFMEDYLLQAKDLGLQDISVLWNRFVIPMLKKYDNVREAGEDRILDVTIRFLKMTWALNQDGYEILFSDLSDEDKDAVAQRLYEEPDSIIRKQLEEISSCEDLSGFLSMYGSICRKEEVRGKIFDISKRIYKEAPSEGRTRITDTLLGIEELRENWEAWIRSRIEEDRTTDGYLFFVEQEAGKMELRYAGIYYSRLYDLAREKGQEGKLSENEEEQISKCEKEIRDVAGNRISEQQMDDFVKMIRNWKIKRINRKIAELPTKELAEYEIEGSAAPESIAQWINCAVQRLRAGEHLMEESYQRFLDRIPMISHWKEERKIGQLHFDKYLEALWESSDCEPRGEMLKRKMLFRLKTPSFEQFSVWSRVRADEEFRDFRLVDEITRENPKLVAAVENESDGTLTVPARLRRVLYRIWKSVTAGEEIKEQDLRRLNRQTCKGRETEVSDMLKQFQKICRKDMEDGKEHRKIICFLNYMLLLKRREEIDDRLKKGQKDRCRRYRKKYEKGDLILNFAKNEVAIVDVNDDWIEQRVREIGTFLSVIEFGKITEDNIKAVSLLVKDCRTIFSEKIDEVERLKKERQDFMDECRRQIASLEEEKKKIEKQLNRLYKILENGGEKIPEKREENEDIRDILKASDAETWIPSAEEEAEEEEAEETIAEETTTYKHGDRLVENLPTCVKDNMPDEGPETIDISWKSNRPMQKPSGKDAGEKTIGLEGQRGKITKLKLTFGRK